MALVLKHQTLAEFATRLREHYRQLSGEELCEVAKFIVAHIANGDFTETQVRNAFGLTVAQWDVVKVRIQNYADVHDILLSAVGE